MPKIEAQEGHIYMNACQDKITDLQLDRFPLKPAIACQRMAVEEFSIATLADEARRSMAFIYMWLVIISGIGAVIIQWTNKRASRHHAGCAKSDGKTASRGQ